MALFGRRKFLCLAAGLAGLSASHRSAKAQSRPGARGTRLITLGTRSGPFPTAHRAQSSNLLIVNGTNYVIDAGDGVTLRLSQAGVELRDIGTIFITHHHDDHTAGLGTLMSVAWDRQRESPINVYGPPPTEQLVKAAIQYYGISAEIRIADGGRSVPLTRLWFGHDVGTGQIYKDSNIRVIAVENSHFTFHQGAAAGKHKSYAYRFETSDRVIVFTGDTGFDEAVADLAKGADLLVTETVSFQDRKQRLIDTGQWQVMTDAQREGIMKQATQGHMTLSDIGKMAARASVKTLVLSHLSARPDNSDNYAAWVTEISQYFSGRVVVASDLMEF